MIQKGTPFSATATGTTSATATFSTPAGATAYITDATASSDLAGGIVQVKSGSTVLWQGQVAANGTFDTDFQTPIICAAGANAIVTITGTLACSANISGFYI